MEALVALGLASNVIQFVDFGIRTVTKCRQIYREGAAIEHQELQHTTTTLSKIAGRIQNLYPHSLSKTHLTQTEIELLDLAKRCNGIAAALQLELLKLSTGSDKGLRASVKKTWSSIRRARAIDELKERLGKEQRLLDTTMLASLCGLVQNAISNDQHLLLQLADTEKAIISDLTCGVQSVAELVKRESERTREEVRDEGLATRDFFKANLQELKTSLTSQDLRQSLLDSLHFPEINLRQEQIKPAFAETFEFLFEDSSSKFRPWSNFTEWLRNDQARDIYWIQGKAGSGKSTLMNLISEDSRTIDNLFVNARGDLQPVLITFFFWNAGTVLQRTAQGLIRSILYQLLDSDVTLFERIYEHSRTSIAQRNPSTVWSFKALSSLLKETISHFQGHVCVLLDGLDEFDDDIEVLTNVVDVLGGSNGIKTCVSSRPLRSLEKYFQGCDGLKLQDLTQPSIRTYVDGRLGKSPEFLQFQARQDILAEQNRSDLIASILTRANGIFLWVTLVITDLLEGINNLDDWDALFQRLNDIPEDIEKIYQNWFHRIESQNRLYRQDAMRSFQLILDREMSLLEFTIATNTSLQELYLETKERVSDKQLLQQCHKRRVHLLVRCMGFLEVSSTKEENSNEPLSEPIDDVERPDLTDYETLRLQHQSNTVGFLHRTAADYVRSRIVVGKSLDRPVGLEDVLDLADVRMRCRYILWEIDHEASERIHMTRELVLADENGDRQPSAASYALVRMIYDKTRQQNSTGWPSHLCDDRFCMAIDFPGLVLEEGYYPEPLGDLVDISTSGTEYLTRLLACACKYNFTRFGNATSGVDLLDRLARLICALLTEGAGPMEQVKAVAKDKSNADHSLTPWALFLHRLWRDLIVEYVNLPLLGEAVDGFLQAGADASLALSLEIVVPCGLLKSEARPTRRIESFYDYDRILISTTARSFLYRLSRERLIGDGTAHDCLGVDDDRHVEDFEVVLMLISGSWVRICSKEDSNTVLAYVAMIPGLGYVDELYVPSGLGRVLEVGTLRSHKTSSEMTAEFENVVNRSLYIAKETPYEDWKISGWSVASVLHMLAFGHYLLNGPSVGRSLEDLLRKLMFSRNEHDDCSTDVG